MSKENTPSLLFIFFSFLSFLHIVQVQLLKANMRALYTQVCVCHAILAQEILHSSLGSIWQGATGLFLGSTEAIFVTTPQ